MIVRHMTNYHDELTTVFHALSDPTRRAVIQRLGRGPASVKELAEPFQMALPSFMQHLKILEEGGLIASKKAGRVRTCIIKPGKIKRAEDWFAQQRALWEKRLDRLDVYLMQIQEEEEEK